MKTKMFLLGPLLVAFSAINVNVCAQSIESQIKVIFGDLLQGNKDKNVRAFGKALSISGDMQYNMELVQAGKQDITINLPQNTHLDPTGKQILPNEGYTWADPYNTSDSRVIPASSLSGNSIGMNATLPPYDLVDLQSRYMIHQGSWINLGNTLLTLFTYNWVSDLNNNGFLELSEFQGKKRTFHYGEQICSAFSFIAKCGSRGYFNPNGKDVGDVVLYSIKILDMSNGKVIAQDLYNFHESQGYRRSENAIYYFSLGNNFPIGKYIITVTLAQANKVTVHTVTSLTEYFEVIE